MGGAASEVTVGRKIHRAATVLRMRCTSRIDPDAWLRPEDYAMRSWPSKALGTSSERQQRTQTAACRARCPDTAPHILA
eukprot:scaffold37411_cov75-Phaeocystis_antarctica.AAC.5